MAAARHSRLTTNQNKGLRCIRHFRVALTPQNRGGKWGKNRLSWFASNYRALFWNVESSYRNFASLPSHFCPSGGNTVKLSITARGGGTACGTGVGSTPFRKGITGFCVGLSGV